MKDLSLVSDRPPVTGRSEADIIQGKTFRDRVVPKPLRLTCESEGNNKNNGKDIYFHT
jgi:hypothetical protein